MNYRIILHSAFCCLAVGSSLIAEDREAEAASPAGQVYAITLESALRLADARNTDIALHLEATKQAVLAEKAAYLEWLPTIRAGGSYADQEGPLQATGGGVANVNRSARYAGLGAGAVGSGAPSIAGASVEIDLARAIFEPLVAKQNKRAMQAADEATRAQILLEVAEAYYALVRGYQAVNIAGQAKEDADRLATVTGDFAETGEGLVADAERAAVESLLMEEERERARGETAFASSELVRMLRLDGAVRLEPAEKYVVPLSIVDREQSEVECIARALANRPELREQEALVKAAKAALRERKFGPLIPKVRGAYSYGDFSGGAGGGPTTDGTRRDLGVAIYWQLNGLGFGQRNATKRRASELREAQLRDLQTVSDIVAEVKAAHALLATADRRFALTKRAVARARKAHALTRERIFQNEGLPLESLQAMESLAKAEKLHLRAATDFNLGQLRLQTAMGGLLGMESEPAAPEKPVSTP